MLRWQLGGNDNAAHINKVLAADDCAVEKILLCDGVVDLVRTQHEKLIDFLGQPLSMLSLLEHCLKIEESKRDFETAAVAAAAAADAAEEAELAPSTSGIDAPASTSTADGDGSSGSPTSGSDPETSHEDDTVLGAINFLDLDDMDDMVGEDFDDVEISGNLPRTMTKSEIKEAKKVEKERKKAEKARKKAEKEAAKKREKEEKEKAKRDKKLAKQKANQKPLYSPEQVKKMSQVAGDVLSCGVPSLYDNFTGEPNDLLYPVLFSFLDLPALNSTRAGYFTRIVYALLNRRTAQTARFIQSYPDLVAKLVRHIKHIGMVELLLVIVHYGRVEGVLDWLVGEDIIPRLLARLEPAYQTVYVANMAAPGLRSVASLLGAGTAPTSSAAGSSGTKTSTDDDDDDDDVSGGGDDEVAPSQIPTHQFKADTTVEEILQHFGLEDAYLVSGRTGAFFVEDDKMPAPGYYEVHRLPDDGSVGDNSDDVPDPAAEQWVGLDADEIETVHTNTARVLVGLIDLVDRLSMNASALGANIHSAETIRAVLRHVISGVRVEGGTSAFNYGLEVVTVFMNRLIAMQANVAEGGAVADAAGKALVEPDPGASGSGTTGAEVGAPTADDGAGEDSASDLGSEPSADGSVTSEDTTEPGSAEGDDDSLAGDEASAAAAKAAEAAASSPGAGASAEAGNGAGSSAASTLPVFLQEAYAYLPDFYALLCEAPDEESVATFGPLLPPLGFQRLKIIKFFCRLLHMKAPLVDRVLFELGVVETSVSLFFEYPWNNFLHASVTEMVVACLATGDQSLVPLLATECRIHELILEAAEENRVLEKEKRKGRLGHMGHLTVIASHLIRSEALRPLLTAHADWVAFVDGELNDVITVNNTPICGDGLDSIRAERAAQMATGAPPGAPAAGSSGAVTPVAATVSDDEPMGAEGSDDSDGAGDVVVVLADDDDAAAGSGVSGRPKVVQAVVVTDNTNTTRAPDDDDDLLVIITPEGTSDAAAAADAASVSTAGSEAVKAGSGDGEGDNLSATLDQQVLKAAKEGDVDKISALLEAGASVNAADTWGNNPLHNACAGRHSAVVRLFVEAGTDIDVANQNGYTPLNKACCTPQVVLKTEADAAALRECIVLLIESGADARKPNLKNQTPLDRAVHYGHLFAVELLLAATPDGANGKDLWGTTPLYRAINASRSDITGVLTRHGGAIGSRLPAQFVKLLSDPEHRANMGIDDHPVVAVGAYLEMNSEDVSHNALRDSGVIITQEDLSAALAVAGVLPQAQVAHCLTAVDVALTKEEMDHVPVALREGVEEDLTAARAMLDRVNRCYQGARLFADLLALPADGRIAIQPPLQEALVAAGVDLDDDELFREFARLVAARSAGLASIPDGFLPGASGAGPSGADADA